MKQFFFLASFLFSQHAEGFTNSIQAMRPTLRMSTLQSDVLPNSVSPPTELEVGAWLPILSIASHAGNDLPISIEVAGEKLVVWNNPINKEWSVMRDVCPHRQAPLSQGRVDPTTGCIECPYHGQQFDKEGACTKIPQSDSLKIPAGTSATAFPVHKTNDLLWAFLPLPVGQASSYPSLPETFLPEIMDAPIWTVRDLPYSADFLIENFMDASHIPFAHHSLQAKRSDGSPVPMQLLTSLDDETLIEVAYQDKIMGKARSGVVSFAPPCYYHFRTANSTGQFNINLMGVVVPVSPGKSRLFLELPGLRKLKGKSPTWLSHALSNRFLESDIWIHDQERFQRNGVNEFLKEKDTPVVGEVAKKYVMTTESDLAPRLYRTWWNKHIIQSPLFGQPKVAVPWISNKSQLDRYEAHAKHCTSCQGALKNSFSIQKYAPYLAIFLAVIAPNRILKILGVIATFLVNEVAGRVIGAVMGYKKGEFSSASQFAPIDKITK